MSKDSVRGANDTVVGGNFVCQTRCHRNFVCLLFCLNDCLKDTGHCTCLGSLPIASVDRRCWALRLFVWTVNSWEKNRLWKAVLIICSIYDMCPIWINIPIHAVLKVGWSSVGWLMLVARLVRAHLDFCTSWCQTLWLCGFKVVTYVAPTLCYKLRRFLYTDLNINGFSEFGDFDALWTLLSNFLSTLSLFITEQFTDIFVFTEYRHLAI